jgi:predicted phosphodiesterase
MKIAIFSDIHDHVWNLKNALAQVQEAELLLCLGDLCSPFIVDMLARGFPDRPIHINFGNNDGDHFRIYAKTRVFPLVQVHGEIFQVVAALRRYPQIALLTDFVIGMPEDTKESLETSCRLIAELDTDDIALSIATPYPGTELLPSA